MIEYTTILVLIGHNLQYSSHALHFSAAASVVPKYTSPTVQDPVALPPPQKRERLSSNLFAQDKRLQTGKFEIYEDVKQSPPLRKISLGHIAPTAPIQQRDVAFRASSILISNTGLGVSKDGAEVAQHQSPRLRSSMTNTGRLAPVRTFLSSSTPRDPGSMNEVDRLRTTLEYINIKDQQPTILSGTCCYLQHFVFFDPIVSI